MHLPHLTALLPLPLRCVALRLSLLLLSAGAPLVALSFVSEAVAHTPTCVDVYMVRARVYKHGGDAVSAFLSMDVCRRMDTADRYLNTKAVRYALRAGRSAQAEELVALFLRDDADGLHALSELQVMWWEYHRGAMYERLAQPGRALKSLALIAKHFSDVFEDQFDFHSYSLRKLTLRAYLAMLRWEDGLRGHRFFVRACTAIVRLYVRLWDDARAKERRERSELDDAQLSEEERKAVLKKHKKQAAKDKKRSAAAAEEEKKAAGPSFTSSAPHPPHTAPSQRSGPVRSAQRLLKARKDAPPHFDDSSEDNTAAAIASCARSSALPRSLLPPSLLCRGCCCCWGVAQRSPRGKSPLQPPRRTRRAGSRSRPPPRRTSIHLGRRCWRKSRWARRAASCPSCSCTRRRRCPRTPGPWRCTYAKSIAFEEALCIPCPPPCSARSSWSRSVPFCLCALQVSDAHTSAGACLDVRVRLCGARTSPLSFEHAPRARATPLPAQGLPASLRCPLLTSWLRALLLCSP